MASPSGLPVTYWLTLLSNRLYSFQEAPSRVTREALLDALRGYQEASSGMTIPTALPQLGKSATRPREWWELQLQEALSSFRVRPEDDRLKAMQEVMQGYMDWLGIKETTQSRSPTGAPTASPDTPVRIPTESTPEGAVEGSCGPKGDGITWGMSPRK